MEEQGCGARSNLQFVIAHNKMLEEALKSGGQLLLGLAARPGECRRERVPHRRIE
jgi:hypothetical protein